MLNNKFRSPVVVLGIAALALAACGGGDDSSEAEGETFEIRLASYQPPNAAEPETTERWAEDIEEATDGRVTFEFFYQEGLLPGGETLQGVGDGRAEMGYIADSYYPAELPLTSVASLPFHTHSLDAQGYAFAELYEENEEYRAEWEDQNVHVLTWQPVPPNVVAAKSEVSELDDLAGQQIRAIGYSSPAFEMAGMNPTALSQGEVYEALQRGVLDATSGGSLDILIDRDYQEVAPHFVEVNSGNYAVTMNVINKDLWESMPEDIQQIITEASDEYMENYVEILSDHEEEACDALLEAGGSATILPESETADWEAEAAPAVLEQWMNDTESSSGADPQGFYDEYIEALERYEAESAEYVPALERCAERQ